MSLSQWMRKNCEKVLFLTEKCLCPSGREKKTLKKLLLTKNCLVQVDEKKLEKNYCSLINVFVQMGEKKNRIVY